MNLDVLIAAVTKDQCGQGGRWCDRRVVYEVAHVEP
jgi:hypothetical protein